MARAWKKPLCASLMLHAAVFAAAGWALTHMIPRNHVDEHTGPIVVIPPESLDLDAPQLYSERPRPEPLPAPTRLPRIDNNDWPSRVMAAAETLRPVNASLVIHPTQLGTLRVHAPVGHGSGGEGQPDSTIIALGTGGSTGGGGGTGASSPNGTGEGTGGEVASLVNGAGGTGGNLWGSGGPVPLQSNAAPAYPPIQRRRGIGGVVHLTLTITEAGTVKDVVVAQSSGSVSLDNAALAAVHTWRFKPVGNGPTLATVTQQINFDLR